MSSLEDEILIEPKRKRGRHENQDLDRLSDLPNCILLHGLSFLETKHAVRTSVLSTRWKHLWKCIPALILHSSGFSTLNSFDRFVDRIMSLHDTSIALSTFDFCRHTNAEPLFLRKIARYISSRSAQLQRLEISVKGDGSLILPCISSCRALTYLKLSVESKDCYISEKTLFPNSLNLLALTTLDLTRFAFCASDSDADCAEPFSLFNSLNSLILCCCAVMDTQILSISSATLVNLTIDRCYSDLPKMELTAPSLSTLNFTGVPHVTLSGSTLFSVKLVNIDVTTSSAFGEHPLVLLSWLRDLPNIESLTVTSNTLLSLKVKMKPLHYAQSRYLEAVMLKNKSRKEASKRKKAFKAGLEPNATIPDRIVSFLLQNSPSAEVDITYI